MTRGSPLAAPTRRLCLTAAGLHLLAEEDGIAVDELLRTRPVSERWRRLMLERLDAVAVIYRLAQALDQAAQPLCFRWFRALPVDAAAALPDGRVLGVVRQGLTADRTAFAKRLWRLREGYRPSAVLLLAPDEARLRHARRPGLAHTIGFGGPRPANNPGAHRATGRLARGRPAFAGRPARRR